MNNIKSIEVVNPVYGLNVGDVLTRETSEDSFSFSAEHVGEDYTYSRSISLSPSLITKDDFVAIEWFEQKKTKRQIIEELEQKLTDSIERENSVAAAHDKLLNRIDSKLKEYRLKFEEISTNVENGVYLNESFDWADEAMTVYHNMIELLEKLTNE